MAGCPRASTLYPAGVFINPAGSALSEQSAAGYFKAGMVCQSEIHAHAIVKFEGFKQKTGAGHNATTQSISCKDCLSEMQAVEKRARLKRKKSSLNIDAPDHGWQPEKDDGESGDEASDTQHMPSQQLNYPSLKAQGELRSR